jgi:hypothetical protein
MSPDNGIEIQGNYRRTYSDIQALDRALVLGDLEAARTAFAHLQKDSPQIAHALSHDPFPAKTPPLRALQSLSRSLLVGNLDLAKRAFHRFHLVFSR